MAEDPIDKATDPIPEAQLQPAPVPEAKPEEPVPAPTKEQVLASEAKPVVAGPKVPFGSPDELKVVGDAIGKLAEQDQENQALVPEASPEPEVLEVPFERFTNLEEAVVELAKILKDHFGGDFKALHLRLTKDA